MRAVLTLLAAAALAATAATASGVCNAHFGPATGVADEDATAVFLTDAAKSDGAVCLDGTPGAYYFRPGLPGVNKWYIHHQGGGWCESPEDCLGRSKTNLGSSSKYPAKASLGGGYFSQDPKENPMMATWNMVFIRYCDGGSFSGSNFTTLNVDGTRLYLRGHHILQAVMADLQTRDIGKATDVVISGCSAGGLATYLHVDEWRSQLSQATKVVGLPDSGFFLDVEDPIASEQLGETTPGNYHDGLRWVFQAQNASSGVNQDCIEAHRSTGDTWMCMFAEHTAPHIKTPVFALQSKYDSWQSDHVLSTKTDAMMNALGANITSRLQANLLSNPHNGAFLDGCYHHCGRWGEILPIDGDEQSTAFLKFYYGITEQTFWNQDVTYPCDKCCI
ncbi:hypothetical protein FNF31_02790 [Cafeteria roenbergensis]|uniref:Pectin acetylesterase n=1 Tax=Cafeteria roenbergensis TaxID=33653 RepID=A0A5A8E1Z6_CAFRO|nr:hypothetical protein FNF31_02790 [Cafeteria roenbergensis]KAA0171815.1 hypothetical protein FNF28_00451 [Cafeteria roenbergensis]